MDEEILNTVHSLFGTGVKIVDCEKKSTVQQEETLLINGVPIKLEGMPGDDATAIKNALLDGQMPSVDLLNQLLYQAGLLRQPIQLETSLSVKSSVVTLEEVAISKQGKLLDERTCETKEDHVYKSKRIELLQPVMQKQMQDVSLSNESKQKITLEEHETHESNLKGNQPITNNAQRSTTFVCTSPTFNDAKNCIGQAKNSIGGGKWGDSVSSVSNYSTDTFSNIHEKHATSAASSSSTIATSTRPMHCSSMDSSATANMGSQSADRSSISCDSGHDGIFHSISQSTAWPHWNKQNTTVTGNSFSSCYDIASSSDEADQKNKSSTNDLNNILNGGKCEYRRPQTNFPLSAYQSCIDEDRVLRYCDGVLMSGSLDSLIMHMVPKTDYSPDMDYQFNFLLCARVFLQPHELLAKIANIWQQQQTLALYSSRSAVAKEIIKILHFWIQNFTYDFFNEQLMQEVRSIMKKCEEIDQSLSAETYNTLQYCEKLLKEFTKYESHLQILTNTNYQQQCIDEQYTKALSDTKNVTPSSYSLMRSESQPITSKLRSSRGNCLSGSGTTAKKDANQNIIDISPNPAELAHQLTAIELEYLSHIGVEELFKAFSKEFQFYLVSERHDGDEQKDETVLLNLKDDCDGSSNKTHSGSDIHTDKKIQNLESYIRWFNRLSYLTATQIVKLQKKKHRVQMIEYWIETARECFNTGNFNSLMAILAGLNLTAVTRLKKTWSKVQSAKFSVLEHQMDPSLNFSSYRSTMKAAVWRSEGANLKRDSVVIPFFTLFLKDLFILNEGFPSRLSNNHINCEKLLHIAKHARNFNKWKKSQCSYNRLPNVTMFLRSAETFKEKALLMASFECEPPENGEERGRYKMLKSATK